MSDFRLTAGWDMDFTQRRAHLVYDAAYRGQRMAIALKHIMGEWFRNVAAGTDYQGAIWGKSTDLSRRAEFRRRVMQVPGIAEVTQMTMALDQNRKLTGLIKVVQTDGTPLEVRFTGRD